jgi:hypothetical protein
MELAGVIFGFLNSIAFFSCSVSRKARDILEDAKRSIFQEFYNRQKEFGRVISGLDIIEEQFEMAVNGIKKIYFSSHSDIHRISTSSRELTFITPITIIGFIFALFSLVIGFFQPKNSNFLSLRNQLIISIPLVIVIFEWLIFWRVIYIEGKLKNIQNKYKYLDY